MDVLDIRLRKCETTLMEKGKLQYGSWMRATNRGGGAKPRSPTPRKSNANSEIEPAKRLSKETEESQENRNLRAIAFKQDRGKNELGILAFKQRA